MNPRGTFTWPLTKGRLKATFPPSSAVIVTFSSPEFAGFFECTLHPASSGTTRKSIKRFMRASCITTIIQPGRVTGQVDYQNRWIAIAGVTDEGALCPLGTIQTPRMAPARALQLYSIAGAKPMFQLL